MEGEIIRVLLQNVPNGDEFLEQCYLHCKVIGYKIVKEKLHHHLVSRIPVFQSYKTWGSQYWGLNKKQHFSVSQHCAKMVDNVLCRSGHLWKRVTLK